MAKFMTVTFDEHNPDTDAGRAAGATHDNDDGVEIDYSPLPRVTMRSALMALLISLGGMM